MFFIYQYHDPRSWDLVYIGMTDNLERRMKQHFFRSNSPVYPLAKELRDLGLQLHSSILDSNPDFEVAKGLEKKYIQEKKPILNTIHNITSDVDPVDKSSLLSTDTPIDNSEDASQDDEDYMPRRNRGKQAFDKTHIRWSIWVRKNLKKQVEKLANEQEASFVALAEEAFKDLLKKYSK
jgi:GIY-YIG catalytic domain